MDFVLSRRPCKMEAEAEVLTFAPPAGCHVYSQELVAVLVCEPSLRSSHLAN